MRHGSPHTPGRRRLLVRRALPVLLLAAAPEAAVAQQPSAVLTVSVADAGGAPLRGAAVVLSERRAGGLTDTAGVLVLRGLAPGPLWVSVHHIGYRSESVLLHLAPGGAVAAGLRLEPEAIPLEEVRVEVEPGAGGQLDYMRGFRERQERGLGYFLTRKEIERRGSTDLSNLLRTVPGLHAPPSRFGQSRIQTARGQPGTCRLQVYVDGVKYRHPADLPGIPTSDIEAIEVYRGRSELPAEFADLEANCGVLVIWSRRHDTPDGAPPP